LNGDPEVAPCVSERIGAPCENAGATTPHTIDKAIKVQRIFNIEYETGKIDVSDREDAQHDFITSNLTA